MTRLLIADDHLMFRAAIKRLLASEPDFAVVAEAADDSEVIASVRSQPVNVAILDLTMSGRDSFDLISHVKSLQPKLPVLILTAHIQVEYAIRSLRAGADGFLTKFDAPEQLVTAVRKLACGGKYICAMVAESLAFEFGGPQENKEKALHSRLSNREYKVFEMLAVGKSTSRIAQELYISTKTVSTHKVRLLQKMNMSNQAELIRYAINNNLMPD